MKIKGSILINVEDIIGKCLGKLKVISYAHKQYDMTLGGERLRHFYMCECECGVTKLIQRGPLKNNIVRSCGCGKRMRSWQE